MANPKYPIPRPGSPISETGSVATREWYNYWQNLEQNSGGPSNADLLNDITIISDKLGSPDGTPENIPPQESGGNVVGINSIASIGVLPGIVTLTLQGDAASPGNTYYYGTNGSGSKGFYTVSSAFLGTADNIDLTTGPDGVTTINLAPVTQTSGGTLRAIALDGFGRVTQNKAATITGTANHITVTNGDASAGLPTIDIATTYAGQTSITTLGNITTGAWNATVIGPTFGGTGLNSYATGDFVYASATNALSKRAIGSSGDVLTVSGGVPVWAAPAFTGTVTSVGLAMPSQFTVTNSPVTSTGTLTAAWNTQAANTALMGPASGSSAAPTFRSPVFADIPYPTDYIIGLKLIWNSATSISVGTGSAVIPSTSKLEVVNSNLTLSSLSLSASTFYHVYLFDNAGTPTIECVTAAPATPYQGTARAKTGDTTRRYLGSVLTDASGNIFNFYHTAKDLVMYQTNINPAPFLVVAGTASSPTSVSCAGVVPPTARIVKGFLANNDASRGVFIGNANVIPSSTNFTCYIGISPCIATIDFILDSSISFQYTYPSSPTGNFVARISGYYLER